jgi:predicted esterase
MTWAEDGAQSAAVSSRIVEKRSFRDIPVVIVRPKEFSPDTRLVVLYHGFGPPQSPQALAEALPLEKLPAVLAYVNLPSVAGRVAAGGIDELKRVQANDFVNGLFFPCLKDAADELPMLVHDIVSSYHLDVRDGIGLFGFSAGGAAALFVLIRSDVPVAAAAILNAPLSVEDNVKNWEHALKRRFQWDDASRAAAESYNVERHAGTITQRKPIPALLLLHGESDDSFDPASVQRTIDALRAAYRQANAEDKFAVKVLAGVGHNFGPDAGKSPETKQATDEIDLKVENWFEKLLISR